MHICIPDSREVRPAHGSAYLLYNVHIDGLYHCSLRFKQLLHLHQALSKKFASLLYQMPSFPPKKLLPLSANQVEERRQQLEKYLQNISQDKTIAQSSIFNLFLLEAQRESTRIDEKHVHLDIELVNGQKIRLPLVTHDSADAVLAAVCRALGLADQYHAYFCLCLCGYDVVRDKLIIKRKLSFFEAPFITLQMAIQQQEQLQSVLSQVNGASSHLSSVANGGRQTINSNNLELHCNCLNCSQRDSQQATGALGALQGVPNLTNNHHLTTVNQQQAPCNGGESIYYRTSNGNWVGRATAARTNTSSYSASWSNTTTTTSATTNTTSATNRSFVTHRILLRKSYWDPIYDSYILNDQQALNLLFIQTVYDMKHSLMFVDRDTYQQLETLLANDSKLEYILLARTLKYYNYVHFEPCYSDYPRPRTKVMISIGSKELNMRVLKTPQVQRPAAANPMQPTSPSSSSTPTSPHHSAAAAASTSATTPTPNAQIETREQPVLYCTSSLVPSGYRDLITKEDLIEEEYNFKVPLIRCWRLTSLETLNSGTYNNNNNNNNNNNIDNNNHPHQQQQQQHQQGRQATSTIAGGKRKSFSLFNSVVGNLNGSCDQQQAATRNPTSNSYSPPPSASGNNGPRVSNIISSGTSGHSLMSTLISTSERNNGIHSSSNVTSSFPSFSSNNGNGDSHTGCRRQQYCSNENCHHGMEPGCGCCEVPPASDNIDQTQLSQYELSFEYLVSRDKLKWITISSDQAIFISISLQGVVDELVSKRDCLIAASQHETAGGGIAIQNQQQLVGGSLGSGSSSSRASSAASANASTPPISIVPARNGSLASRRQKLSESFTYLYRDGAQKLLKTQSIDRFCVALGGGGGGGFQHAATNYSTSRRTSGTVATPGGNSLLPQSAPTNSRHSSALQTGGFWNLDSRILGSSPSRYLFGYGQPSSNQQSTFEIANVKKAPSPIINDAFEGVTNEDDL